MVRAQTYDARRGLTHDKPVWRGWLHVIRLRRLDHVMIFGLIARTSTPIHLLGVGGGAGRALCSMTWALAVAAALTHLIWMSAPELLVGSTFAGLGLLGIAGLPALLVRSGVAALVLMLTGGVLYLLGALLYRCRWPDPSPERFGLHEVFHALVCAAAMAQFVAIAAFVT